METIDLATLGPAALATWIFNRPVANADAPRWYTDQAFETDQPARLLRSLTTIFLDFPATASCYSREQIDQGLWAILSCAGINAARYLTRTSVPIQDRMDFIESMYRVFAAVASRLQPPYVENAYYMWFDLVCKAFWLEVERPASRFRVPQTEEEAASLLRMAEKLANYDIDAEWSNLTPEEYAAKGRRADAARATEATCHLGAALTADQQAMRGALFEALTRILKLDHQPCQSSALHGLGHLHDPRVAGVVQVYIDQHAGDWPPDSRDYLESCRDGTVL